MKWNIFDFWNFVLKELMCLLCNAYILVNIQNLCIEMILNYVVAVLSDNFQPTEP